MRSATHKLRHTYATNHYKENKDLVLLRDQLGHTSVEVTSIYTNINNEKKREAIDRLEKDNLNKTGYFLKEVSCFIGVPPHAHQANIL